MKYFPTIYVLSPSMFQAQIIPIVTVLTTLGKM